MLLNYEAPDIWSVFNAVKKCSKKWSPKLTDEEEIWFRGDGASYPLLPGLYREHIRKLNYLEESLQERFKTSGAPHVDKERAGDDWDWYFRAQHYGIPTRLLDWSEGLLVAIYFALAGHIDFRDRKEFDRIRTSRRRLPRYDSKSPVIWVMDAGTLTRFSQGEEFDCVFTVGGKRVAEYTADSIEARKHEENRHPLSILPHKSNPRIVAQQGVFTLHGHGEKSIDELAAPADSCIRLARITLDRANLFKHWHDLERFGVYRTSIFPDLESVARVICWIEQAPDEDSKNKIAGAKKKKKKKSRRKKRTSKMSNKK